MTMSEHIDNAEKSIQAAIDLARFDRPNMVDVLKSVAAMIRLSKLHNQLTALTTESVAAMDANTVREVESD